LAEAEVEPGGALDGIVVLEFGREVAAPFCGKLLADYGATVIKIEPPGAGDPARQLGPFPDSGPDREQSALYLYLNTNKQSVTLDVEQAAGLELALELVRKADILIENHSPLEMCKWGLGYGAAKITNPRLVYVSLSAFGQDGPWSQWKATNLTSLASGGQMHLTGDADREPLKAGGQQADYQLGLNGFSAALVGLWDALETGEGQWIDVSAQEAMASTLEISLNMYSYTGRDLSAQRRGNLASALMGIYPCADGYLGLHAMPRNVPPLMRVMEREDLLEDERFATPAARLQHNDELMAEVFAWAVDKPKHEVYQRAGSMRGPIAFVHDMADLFTSPQLAARGFMQEVEHPVAGRLTYPGAPFQMSGSPARVGRAPLLGEHTSEVLRGLLGLSDSDLRALSGQGVI
jgi:crotonobetainyl-CoA:carnitine CoA-transferase CaiB-like acyl-CoA transferase